jgi:hypothetical protein
MKNDFSNQLTKLRKQRNLTNVALAELARVPTSLIAGLQSGKRRIGEFQARKIGLALGLQKKTLERFILNAITYCSEKLLQEAQYYPAQILNTLPSTLLSAGISADNIYVYQLTQDDPLTSCVDMILHDGREAHIVTTVEIP